MSPIAFPELAHPVVQAPMAGGPSTPALAAAVSEAGGLGSLAAGYKAPDAVREDVRELRRRTERPFGLNLLIAGPQPVDSDALERYGSELAPEAERYGVELGDPRSDDDHRAAKVAVAFEERAPIVSFAFGCPTAEEIAALRANGSAVWVTVTEPEEARIAAEAGADALVVQGVEAGGHRGSFVDRDEAGTLALVPLLRLVARAVDLPLVAAGGIMDGAGIAAALAAGATAAQLGTAFLRCPEAGTSAAHREALRRAERTALTRAFSGRRARGLENRFQREHSAEAPAAYPHVHHLTAPLRTAARAAGDAEAINLWAGQGFPLGRELPAADLVWTLGEESRSALEVLGRRSREADGGDATAVASPVVPNVYAPWFEADDRPPGYRARRARLGHELATELIGLSVWELPPGQRAYPYHFHYADEELVIVLRGRPTLRSPTGERALEEGEVVSFPLGEEGAHQISNPTDATVTFLALSSHGRPDVVVYPDSGKIGVGERLPRGGGLRAFFRRGDAVDYWSGEGSEDDD